MISNLETMFEGNMHENMSVLPVKMQWSKTDNNSDNVHSIVHWTCWLLVRLTGQHRLLCLFNQGYQASRTGNAVHVNCSILWKRPTNWLVVFKVLFICKGYVVFFLSGCPAFLERDIFSSCLVVHFVSKHTYTHTELETQPLTALAHLTRGKLVWSTRSLMGWVFLLLIGFPKPLSVFSVCLQAHMYFKQFWGLTL